MKSSPTLQVLMAASIYLSLLWGYLILQTPQHFAAFSAFILCIAVFFWVSETRSLEHGTKHRGQDDMSADGSNLATDPSLSSSLKKLEALKAELSEQYAQFGKDQTAMNSKALGTWQRSRKPDSNK